MRRGFSPRDSATAAPAVVKSDSADARLEQLLKRMLKAGAGAVLTVRSEKGSSVDVSQQPKGSMKINMEPSGAM